MILLVMLNKKTVKKIMNIPDNNELINANSDDEITLDNVMAEISKA